MTLPTCISCGTSEQERPLLNLRFQGQELFICPQCLPNLIHKPYLLAEKFSNYTPPENPPADDH